MSEQREARGTRVVGRYEILQEIGRGGMAVVYLAQQRELERQVALKELAGHGADPAFARRFLRESRVAGQLAHPNIVTVHEYFEADGIPYIAMEYVPRGSLRPLVGTLTTRQAFAVFEDLLSGLAHAEARHVVHRDLKPENLMVTAHGRIKIGDFGIARALNRAATGVFMTATGAAMGTPAYMAPEQALGEEPTAATDLYSVGVIAYELFVGRLPFEESESPMAMLLHQVNDDPALPHHVNRDLDPGLSDWIGRLLVKDPSARTRSATEAWEELEDIAIRLFGPRWRRDGRIGDFASPMAQPALPPTAGDVQSLPPSREGTSAGAARSHATPTAGSAASRGASESLPASAPPATARSSVATSSPSSVVASATPQTTESAPPLGYRRRRPWKIASAVGAIVIVAVALVVFLRDGGESPRRGERTVRPTVLASVALASPWGIAVGDRDVWVTNRTAGTLSRIDAVSSRVTGAPLVVGKDPIDVAINGLVWVANRGDGTIVAVDPATARLDGDPVVVSGHPSSLAAFGDSLWVADYGDGTVRRIDIHERRAVGPVIHVGRGVNGIAAGRDGVWIVNYLTGSVLRIDPRRERVVGRPVRTGKGSSDVALAAGSVWVSNFSSGTITRLDARTARIQSTVSLAASCVTATGDSVWAAAGNSVVRIDASTGRTAGRPVNVGGNENCLRAGAAGVWVAVQSLDRVVRVGQPPAAGTTRAALGGVVAAATDAVAPRR